MQAREFVEDKEGVADGIWQAWFSMIRTCHEHEPAGRPTFTELHAALGSIFYEVSGSMPPLRDIGAAILKLARRAAHPERQRRPSFHVPILDQQPFLDEDLKLLEDGAPARGGRRPVHTASVAPAFTTCRACSRSPSRRASRTGATFDMKLQRRL